MNNLENNYDKFLSDLKSRIIESRYQAARTVNQELILLYWHIGNSILGKQVDEGWGTKVIKQLSSDLCKAFPEMKGFSIRNLKYMRKFAKTWNQYTIVQQLVAQLPWGHNIAIF